MNTLALPSVLAPSPRSIDPDADLVSQFQAGDESAFSHIVAAHRARIHGYVRKLLRNETDAEEVTQDTFVRAYQHLKCFRGDATLSTWLHRIATNLAHNRYWYFFRRRRHLTVSLDHSTDPDSRHTLHDSLVCPAPDPCQEFTEAEFIGVVRRCIAEIDPIFREALELRAAQGQPYAEIARRTGVPVGTVKSRIARARLELRQRLADTAPEIANTPSLNRLFETPRH